jgi:hypothetical protein
VADEEASYRSRGRVSVWPADCWHSQGEERVRASGTDRDVDLEPKTDSVSRGCVRDVACWCCRAREDRVAPGQSFDGRRVLTVERESPTMPRSVWESPWTEPVEDRSVGDCLAAFYLPRFTRRSGDRSIRSGFSRYSDTVASLYAHADGSASDESRSRPAGG